MFWQGVLLCHSCVLGGIVMLKKGDALESSFIRLRENMVSSFISTGVYPLMFEQAQAFLGEAGVKCIYVHYKASYMVLPTRLGFKIRWAYH